MQVFSGCTSKIIGAKGAVITELKKQSGVKDIQTPPREEEGEPKRRPRDLVDVTIIGKPAAIAKAKELIQEIVDKWVSSASFLLSSTSIISPNDFLIIVESFMYINHANE